MTQTGRNALIFNAARGPSGCPECARVFHWLEQSDCFQVLEKAVSESLPLSISVAPDLAVLHHSRSSDRRFGLGACKNQWVDARLLVVVCSRENICVDELLAALSSADDFVCCSTAPAELRLRVDRLLQTTKAGSGCAVPKDCRRGLRGLPLIGEHPGFIAVLEKTSHLARAAAAVLISGETGSGKELFARAIHYQGDRQSKPFIPVNCGALPDHLFENELFGHIKGAFTDASSAEKGLIAEAEGGTLFLDEIDALTPAAQIKLLRFLQNGEYRQLGSSRSVIANVRVIAATNSDLQERVSRKQFREDLFYRLNVLTIAVPALRERGTDVLRLAEHFLELFAARNDRTRPVLTAAARRKLVDYIWPGNVRELEGVMQRAVLLNSSGTLHATDIELPEGKCRDLLARESLRRAKSLVIGDFERGYLANLLAEHNGNISQAARAAGKDRRTLQRLVRKYSLKRESFKL